jgi:hypothetical protein
MKAKAILIVCLLIVTVAGWLLVTGVRPTPAADAPQTPAPEVGRYQVIMTGTGNAPLWLFDTATGQLWRNDAEHKETPKWSGPFGPPKQK